MDTSRTLGARLDEWASDWPVRRAVADTVNRLASAAAEIAALVAAGPLAGDLAAELTTGEAGEGQKELDVRANDIVVASMRGGVVAAVASEEMDAPFVLDETAPLLVSVDPLDGSSNIDTNLSVGTIFSVLPRRAHAAADPAGFLRPGREQLASGYFIYGPHAALVLTVGEGTDLYVLDPASRAFVLSQAGVTIAPTTREFAINASNYRHWDDEIRLYFDDCIKGAGGPRGVECNMRWLASMVAEAHRIFRRGGVYMYPGDSRKGYRSGRLRLTYEAAPIAFLVEQAGGAASTGTMPILDVTPAKLHERTPLVFGSREEVERVVRYQTGPEAIGERSPLFGRRGLFLA